jgi:hypothetical protein
MTLLWEAPATTGGCPITSYSIFQQDLVDPSQFAEVDPDQVNNLIALRSHTISYDPSYTGLALTYYISARNIAGEV